MIGDMSHLICFLKRISMYDQPFIMEFSIDSTDISQLHTLLIPIHENGIKSIFLIFQNVRQIYNKIPVRGFFTLTHFYCVYILYVKSY